MTYTLKLFNTGQVTLPKKWREKYNTENFIAEERDGGLYIRPIIPSPQTVYYENQEGFGIFNESGIDTDQLIAKITELHNG
ncbi:MAG: AbrB/MazE/SpoVT family DNA-binding domain-containing protein [Candidatus Peribacteria bacterium]|nr:MAG: AbrB/MazE/SpoVT family DNA-binding domain-containing protein [Candidatus Peribacteria bacterium]